MGTFVMLAEAQETFDWAGYLVLAGLLLFGYVCVRSSWESVTILPRASKKPLIFDGKSIETSELSNRIRHVREELTEGKTPQRPANFKRAIAVENKRAEIAKLAFFQPHPPVEPIPQNPEDGLHLLLI